MANPEIIFADEPTAALDHVTGAAVVRMLKALGRARYDHGNGDTRPTHFRLRVILRRLHRSDQAESANDRMLIGDLQIEPGSQSVLRNGELVPLTGAAYGVLESLIQSAGQVVDKDSISRHALGRRIMPYDRSVDAHVANLRKKLGPLSDGRQRMLTLVRIDKAQLIELKPQCRYIPLRPMSRARQTQHNQRIRRYWAMPHCPPKS